MATFISRSPEATIRLGQEWGPQAEAGWVIALTGDLGAGKTQLVKGIALGLGATDRVHSPTFTLVNEYRGGRLCLHHLDLYRLDTVATIQRAGLEEYLCDPPGVAVIEWAEKWFDAGGPPAHCRLRRVWLEILTETQRRIRYDDLGT